MRRALAIAVVLLVASPASAETWLERLERDHQAELAALGAIECRGDLRGLIDAPDPMDAAAAARVITDAVGEGGTCAPHLPFVASIGPGMRLYRRAKLALAGGDLDLVISVLRLGLDFQRGGGLLEANLGSAITATAVARGSELVAGGATGLDDLAAALDAMLAAQPPFHDVIRGEAAAMVADHARPADTFIGAVRWEAFNRARDELGAVCVRDATPGACLAGLLARTRRPAWTPIRWLTEDVVDHNIMVLVGAIRQRAAIHALRLEVAVCAGVTDREALLAPPALGMTLELFDEGGGAWRVDAAANLRPRWPARVRRIRQGRPDPPWANRPLHRFRC